MFEFKFPDVGEGIHEGEIVNWLVEEGDEVEADQDIVEVMTDKATVQISAPKAGTIQEIRFQEGDVVEVGDVFVVIQTEGDAGSADAEPAGSEGRESQEQPSEGGAPDQPGPAAADTDRPAAAAPSRGRTNGGAVIRRRTPEGVLAPPSVRLEARRRGVDIAEVEGSGPAGRISMEDLEAHGAAAEPAGSQGARPGSQVADRLVHDLPSVSREDARWVEPIQAPAGSTRASAHRSTTLQPHFTHVVTVGADRLQDALVDARGDAEADLEIGPEVLVVQALARALADHPRLNALVDEREDELVLMQAVNVAVAVPSDAGHEIRVVADAQRKGMLEIARTLARGGDDAEPTITIAVNGDTAGYVSTPVLVHPQVAGAVLGSLRSVAVLDEDGSARPATEMNLAFSFDHRWIDGYHGALLAEDVKRLLERPRSMLLE